MYEYKLEAHLSALCAQYPRYINLNSTWTLNKRACSDMLKSVVLRYPHFSMHDASHAEAVVSKMEMLLGDRVQKLSPTDTWLLLHAAYAHDLGMVVKWSEIEAAWEQPEFVRFLSSLSASADPELREAASFIQNTKDVSSNQVWPLKAYRYVSLVNAAFFRGQHARFSKDYIGAADAQFALDLGHNGLIQPRLIKLLGQICALHTETAENVLNLDYQTNGFDSDYAHPRFAAMLLRLGDLLDIDNGRFNTGAELSFGGLPETSIPHKDKHNATTQLLVTPAEIRFRSDCPNSKAYLETRQFVTWLEGEVDFLTKYWAKIVPKDLGGYAPCFDSKELLIHGVRDIEGVAGLRFEISQDKAFQIIEGSNIYEDPFVFIREVIQNALDASKLQLWNDLTSGTYRAWLGSPDLSTLQPYELDKKIYESYPIQVRLSTLPDGRVQVEVEDRGTGISVESFKRMCNVGSSNSGSKQLRETIQGMPNWLRPTAGFGIGLQSIFLLTDQFEIRTSTGVETFHAVVHSKRAGGYLQLQRVGQLLPRGTTLQMRFRVPENIRFSADGETSRYLDLHLDPMSTEDHTGEVRVLEAIHENCKESMFPVCVTCEEASIQPLEIMSQLPVAGHQWKEWDGRYHYLLDENADRIQLWDKQAAAYGEFCFCRRVYRDCCFRFKGMEVSKETPSLRIDGISVLFDAYGLDTKETITLDRSALTREGSRQVGRLLQKLIETFIEILLKHFSDRKQDVQGKFDPYTFWRICNDGQRRRIPEYVLDTIQNTVTVIRKNAQGRYEPQEVPVRELIPRLYTVHFVDVNQFEKYEERISIDYPRICEILNRAENLEVEQIAADFTLRREMNRQWLRTLQIPVPDEPLHLYILSSDRGDSLEVQGDARTAVLKGLGGQIPGMQYYGYSFSKERPAKRYAIPALPGYSALAVDKTPAGIAEPIGRWCALILSPFVREEEEKRPSLSKEQFTDMVTSSETFPNVVEYVVEHSVCKSAVTREQIIADYRKLMKDYYDVMLETSGSNGENHE